MDHKDNGVTDRGNLPPALALVGEALGRLRYGAIQLTVHDGKVMQIDITRPVAKVGIRGFPFGVKSDSRFGCRGFALSG